MITRTNAGYRARLYGGNHELVFITETYVNKAGAQHAISIAKANAASAPIYDQT